MDGRGQMAHLDGWGSWPSQKGWEESGVPPGGQEGSLEVRRSSLSAGRGREGSGVAPGGLGELVGLPRGLEWSRSSPGELGGIWEAHMKGQEGSGGPSGELGRLGELGGTGGLRSGSWRAGRIRRPSQSAGRGFRGPHGMPGGVWKLSWRSGRGRESTQEGREYWQTLQ